MKRTRAWRRAQRKRIRSKRIRQGHWSVYQGEEYLSRAIDTPTPCSCPLCGNPRKYFGERTVQERRDIGRR